jgi:hypothetical protein
LYLITVLLPSRPVTITAGYHHVKDADYHRRIITDGYPTITKRGVADTGNVKGFDVHVLMALGGVGEDEIVGSLEIDPIVEAASMESLNGQHSDYTWRG